MIFPGRLHRVLYYFKGDWKTPYKVEVDTLDRPKVCAGLISPAHLKAMIDRFGFTRIYLIDNVPAEDAESNYLLDKYPYKQLL